MLHEKNAYRKFWHNLSLGEGKLVFFFFTVSYGVRKLEISAFLVTNLNLIKSYLKIALRRAQASNNFIHSKVEFKLDAAWYNV